ncbi:MAG: hydroxyisourate hydrolase [Acidobacteriota bacterium]|nr:hydroxyisourate hydrolase [Acidobacteriota bacterium]
MSGISTHILDTEKGRPASGVPVTLECHTGAWHVVSESVTDDNGRVAKLLPDGQGLAEDLYRLTFRTGGPFFPEVAIVFQVADAAGHYHVPLLLSSYGYSTYRGS